MVASSICLFILTRDSSIKVQPAYFFVNIFHLTDFLKCIVFFFQPQIQDKLSPLAAELSYRLIQSQSISSSTNSFPESPIGQLAFSPESLIGRYTQLPRPDNFMGHNYPAYQLTKANEITSFPPRLTSSLSPTERRKITSYPPRFTSSLRPTERRRIDEFHPYTENKSEAEGNATARPKLLDKDDENARHFQNFINERKLYHELRNNANNIRSNDVYEADDHRDPYHTEQYSQGSDVRYYPTASYGSDLYTRPYLKRSAEDEESIGNSIDQIGLYEAHQTDMDSNTSYWDNYVHLKQEQDSNLEKSRKRRQDQSYSNSFPGGPLPPILPPPEPGYPRISTALIHIRNNCGQDKVCQPDLRTTLRM